MTKTMLKPHTPKGFRDILPEEALKRRFVLGKIITVLERFGYDPLETPAIEYASILEGKYGEEERLIYKFKDRGDRDLALRFDLTVPLARVITQYGQTIPAPFKRYQIQPVWRAEKPQAGRFREFLQCDFDIIGVATPIADAEIIAVVDNILTDLGFTKYLILFNDRRVMDKVIKQSGIKTKDTLKIIRTLDKLEKIGEEEVIAELLKQGLAQTKIEMLMALLGRRPLLPKKKTEELSLEPIDAVMSQLKNFAIPQKRVFYTPTLARGLDYYTGMIIEATIEGYAAGSVGGGGRYDKLIGIFSGRSIPAVGFAFGIDRLMEAMLALNLFPICKTTQVLVTIFREDLLPASAKLVNELRTLGFNSEMYLDPSEKLARQIKYADKKGVPFVVIIGPDEVGNGTVTIKNLESGMQETIPRSELAKKLS